MGLHILGAWDLREGIKKSRCNQLVICLGDLDPITTCKNNAAMQVNLS